MARACDDLSDPTISFGDNITIRNISDLKDDLLGDLTLAGRLTLVIDDDALVDLSGVQLIVAAQAFARREGKALRLARPAGGNLRRVLERAGFLANPAPDAARFWLHAEQA